ncbi:MAG: helix-turn-helix transcriptional regulator [Lachnospiraceae bacterium]|nr:helix-turn-helix transcriptional regulator [Lachnospiraceae bacterium]
MGLNYKVIGNRIQNRRKAKGITQAKMAEALDVSVGFISQVERGVCKVSLDSLAAMAEYLDCPPSALLDDSNRYQGAYSQTDFNTMYELLSPTDQRLFYYMLEVYAKNRELL